ncbi:hypothetical protein D3C85_1541440 [compost metagenome]
MLERLVVILSDAQQGICRNDLCRFGRGEDHARFDIQAGVFFHINVGIDPAQYRFAGNRFNFRELAVVVEKTGVLFRLGQFARTARGGERQQQQRTG